LGLTEFNPRITLNPYKLFIKACKDTTKYLQYGFTTIRNAGVFDSIDIHVRDAINEGLFLGPRVIASGMTISPALTDISERLYEMSIVANTVDEIKSACRNELAKQANFIKIYASGSALDRNGIPMQSILTDEEIKSAVETTTMKGSYVAAHAHSPKSIISCIKQGVKTIEHASFIDDEGIELLKQSKNTYLVPTLAAMYQNEERTRGTEYEYLIDKLKWMLDVSSKRIEKAYKEGFKLGFGTDCAPGQDQYEQGTEFKFRKEYCHMDNIDILLQATKNSAEILGISDITGEIKEGLCADLILVDGNPDEDISVMYKKPEMVIAKGIRVK
ncbi:MAG: amidohydrolase family protein, partial [Intestinibacter sp.]|uniref:metal-dependent hydrolase family protein n=1 Tax=Intestinibacter sp. TaxID=1965304 RepID=UPI003F175087